MPAVHFLAEQPEQVGLDGVKVQALFERAEREVRAGLLPATQVAIARNGKIGAMQTFGRAVQGGKDKAATANTRFVIMSATKAVTSASAWILMQEKKLHPGDRAADYLPEFASNGKDAITIEQLLVHTSGIPYAPHWQKEWADPERRLYRFRQWKPDHEPGTRFIYHVSANFWPIAAVIEKITGKSLADFVKERIAEPLGLPDLRLGLPPDGETNVADVEWVGEAPTEEEYEKMGVNGFNATTKAIDENGVLELNETATRKAGSPSAGCITTAGDIALFYQALLEGGCSHDGENIWHVDMLEDARRVRTGDLRDPYLGHKANRALGIAVAGADGKSNMRGFGRTNSALSFGHPGFGGQSGWADPATGISFGFLTNGFDRHDIREARRRVSLSSLAASCAI